MDDRLANRFVRTGDLRAARLYRSKPGDDFPLYRIPLLGFNGHRWLAFSKLCNPRQHKKWKILHFMDKGDPRAAELLNEVMKAYGWDRTQLADRLAKKRRTIDGIFRSELAMAQDMENHLQLLLNGHGGGTALVRESAPDYELLKKVIHIRETGSAAQNAILDAFLETLTQQIPKLTSATVTTDAEGRVIEINEAFTEMCGYTLAELRDKKPGEVLRPKTKEDERGVVEEFRRAISERRPHQCDLTNYMKDGTPYRVRIEMFPIFDGSGRLTQFKAIENKL